GQKLRRDLRNGNVVDIDVLLADQVQQQVERAVVNLPHEYGERRLVVIGAGLDGLAGRFSLLRLRPGFTRSGGGIRIEIFRTQCNIFSEISFPAAEIRPSTAHPRPSDSSAWRYKP